jgi:cell division protease FtsH
MIDEEVKRILEEQYARALTIIRNNRERIELLVETLMEIETLDRPQFEELMNAPLADLKLNGSLETAVPSEAADSLEAGNGEMTESVTEEESTTAD